MPDHPPIIVRRRSIGSPFRIASTWGPRRTPTLQGRMFLLVVVVALPLLLLSAAVAFFVFTGERDRAEDRIRMQTRTLALVVDQEIAKAEILLKTLAGSSSLARGDLDAFTAEAVAASTMFANAPIGLIGADHRQVLNTACPREQQGACDGATDPLPTVLASGHAEITDLVQGTVTGRPLIAVGVPVFAQQSRPEPDRRLAFTVGLVLPAGLIAAALSQQPLVAGQIVSVLDRTGAVVARTEGEAGALGQHLRPELMAAVAQSSQRVIHGLRTLQGTPAVMVFARAPHSGFVVVVNIPETLFAAPLWAALTRTFIIGLLVLAMGLGCALYLGRRVSASLRQLATLRPADRELPQDSLREVTDLAHALAETGAERDRTEAGLRHGKARLREANMSLEAQVAQEVAAREAAQAKLAMAQRMQALGQLAGGVAHDFNNLLQAVSSGTRLLYQRADDPEAVKRLAAIVGDAADRGAAVTRRLLAFAQRSALAAEPLDAAQVLAALHEVLAHTLGYTAEVHVEVEAGLPLLLADRGQLETVLVHLATNARDAMQPDGGVLTFFATRQAISSGDVHPAGLAQGRYVCLCVSDTGAGMDAPTLARAVEPFFTTKPVGKGTGLGLAMARGFAEQSGGALSITSAPGCGTTVLLWLPQAEDALKPVPVDRTRVPRRDGAAKTRTPRILLVDDDAAVRELLTEELIGRDFHVEQAGDGASALEQFGDGGGIDLLVSDLSMPSMDGLALITAVQQRRPGLPAILLTGYARDDVSLAVGGALRPAYTLLCKPVRALQLCDCIARLLEDACILDAPLTMDRRRSAPPDRRRTGRADRRSTPPPTVG
jgi:signal transduction histidine kinase/ActR/RegA family two-component response regulator